MRLSIIARDKIKKKLLLDKMRMPVKLVNKMRRQGQLSETIVPELLNDFVLIFSRQNTSFALFRLMKFVIILKQIFLYTNHEPRFICNNLKILFSLIKFDLYHSMPTISFILLFY